MKRVRVSKLWELCLMNKVRRVGYTVSRPVLLNPCAVCGTGILGMSISSACRVARWDLGQAEPQRHGKHSHLYSQCAIRRFSFSVHATMMGIIAGNIVLDHWFSVCTVMWMSNHLGILWRRTFWFSGLGLGPKIPHFQCCWSRGYCESCGPGDCACGSQTLVFVRITWEIWLKCCFQDSNL